MDNYFNTLLKHKMIDKPIANWILDNPVRDNFVVIRKLKNTIFYMPEPGNEPGTSCS